jgi:DNA-directed RNA polymerase subunit RPC12/RpoP
LVKCAECGKEIPKGKEKKKVVEGTPQTYCPRCVDMLTGTERK